jgi:phage host-nuclease inhibitor protein Gam
MSSKINKLEINISSSSQNINQPKKPNFDEPDSLSKKEKSNEIELDSLLFERTKEEDEEIQKLEKIYQDKLKEIEHLTNEIKTKDDEIILMNNAKNKIYNINQSNSGEENKNINLEKREISEEELKEELLKLGQEYNDQVQKCTKLHEEKIKNMKDEIGQLKNKINTYYNKNEYILKEEHDKFLSELKKKHEQELEPLKKELNDLEKFISDNFPNLKI